MNVGALKSTAPTITTRPTPEEKRLFAAVAAQAGVLTRDLQQDLTRSRALVADVERRMHEFAQAALVTWESRVD